MDSEYIYALIGIGGTLLGTFVGAFITIFHERIKENEQIKSEIRIAINEVAFAQVTNDLPIHLNKLRATIVKHAHILAGNEELVIFFAKWLNRPELAFNSRISNFLDSERIEEMQNDLDKIKL